MSKPEILQVLIVHPLNVVAELFRFRIESEYNCQVEISSSFTLGLQAFDRSNFSIVLSASDILGENAKSFFRHVFDSGKAPFFFLIETKKGGMPLLYKDHTPNEVLPEENLLENLGKSLEKILSKTKDTSDEWTKISLVPLIYFDGVPEDVYIQLRTGRFLKLFTRGDKITFEDVARYEKKGVKKLYLKKAAFIWLLKQLDQAMPSILSNPNEAIVVSGSQDSIASEENNLPLETPIQLQEEIIKEVHQVTKNVLVQMKKNKELARFLKALNVDRSIDSYFRSRIDLVCNISCAMAKELSWNSESMYEKLIYLAYVHDLTLMENPKLARIQTLAELDKLADLTSEEKKLVLDHPKAAAEMIIKDPRAPAEAALIIQQHHELPGGGGFPDGLQTLRILPTAALLEIAISFAQYILDNPQWKFAEFSNQNSARFRGGPFTKIFKALENICRGKV